MLFSGATILCAGIGAFAESQFGSIMDVQAIGVRADEAGSISIPLLKDYSALLLGLGGISTACIARWQWLVMRRAIPKLVDTGAIAFSDSQLVKLVQSSNESLRRWGGAVPTIVSIALIWFLLVENASWQFHTRGIYESFAPPEANSSDWALDAYDGWWARPSSYAIAWSGLSVSIRLPIGAGAFAYNTIAVGIFYILALQNLVGLHCLVVLRRLAQKRIQKRLILSDANNCFGWTAFAEILRTVRVALFIDALMLTAFGAMFGPQSLSWLWIGISWIIVAAYCFLYLPIRQLQRIGNDLVRDELDRIKNGPAAGLGTAATERRALTPGECLLALRLAEIGRWALFASGTGDLLKFYGQTAASVVLPLVITNQLSALIG
ncbi:MAG: hypothetical protein ACT4OS_11110 [Acidimicrobiales bacterium]